MEIVLKGSAKELLHFVSEFNKPQMTVVAAEPLKTPFFWEGMAQTIPCDGNISVRGTITTNAKMDCRAMKSDEPEKPGDNLATKPDCDNCTPRYV